MCPAVLMTATVWLILLRMAAAKILRRDPSLRAASRMRSRVSGRSCCARGCPDNVRETDPTSASASLATSFNVTAMFSPIVCQYIRLSSLIIIKYSVLSIGITGKIMIISLAKRLEFYPIFGKIKKGLMSETQIPSKMLLKKSGIIMRTINI